MNHTLRRERLKTFFQAYFHEDWDLDDPDPSAIVERYVEHALDPSQLLPLADDIADLLTAEQDGTLERTLFDELGCYYDPSGDDRTVRDWLEWVVARLRQSTDPTR